MLPTTNLFWQNMASKSFLICWLNICLKFGHGIVFFPMQCCATILIVLPTWMVLVPMSWSLDTKWYCLMFWVEIKPDVVVSCTFKTYCEKLKKNLNYLCSILQTFRSERNDVMNRSKTYHCFQAGQLVYMYQAKGTIAHTGSRRIACYFVVPFVIYRTISPNQFLLMSPTGQIYPFSGRGNEAQTWCYMDY